MKTKASKRAAAAAGIKFNIGKKRQKIIQKCEPVKELQKNALSKSMPDDEVNSLVLSILHKHGNEVAIGKRSIAKKSNGKSKIEHEPKASTSQPGTKINNILNRLKNAAKNAAQPEPSPTTQNDQNIEKDVSRIVNSVFAKHSIEQGRDWRKPLHEFINTVSISRSGELVKIYQCTLCPASSKSNRFREKNAINEHICKNHFGSCYTCDKCNASFAHLSQYVRHYQTHDGVKKMRHQAQCQICGHMCKSRAMLYRHQRDAHRQKKAGIYRCELCTKPFGYQRVYMRHMLVDHGISEQESKRMMASKLLDLTGITHQSLNDLTKLENDEEDESLHDGENDQSDEEVKSQTNPFDVFNAIQVTQDEE